MKNWNTILLGFISIGLLAYIYLDVWKSPSTTQIEKQARKVGLFKYDTVKRVELTNSKGEFVFVKNKDQLWEIEKPISYPADNSGIREMLMEIDMARRLDTIKKNPPDFDAALEQYALKEPRIKITMKTEKDSETISIGRLAAVHGAIYALLQGDNLRDIVVIDQNLEEFLSKDLDQWRSHAVFDFFPQLITGIMLRRDQQEVEIKKNRDEIWEISKPLLTRADDDQIQKFLNEVLKFRAKKFVSETDSSSPTYGLSASSVIFEISDLKQTRTLKIGSVVPDDPESVYAACGARSVVFTLPKNVLTTLGNILDAVRDRRIVSYPYTAAVKQLSIDYDGIHYKLQRGDKNTWYFSDTQQKADFSAVDSFLGQLFASRVAHYPDTANPHSFGFAKPTATVYWSAKSPTSEPYKQQTYTGKYPEEEILLFGAISGDEIFLQTPRQPVVVTLPKKILDHFPKKPWSWNSLKIFDFHNEPIEKLTWKTDFENFSANASEDRSWKSDQGNLNMQVINLQLKILNDLTAVRWIGTPGHHDFAKPLLTLAVKHANTTDYLIFGKELDDNTVVTALNDETCAFLISKRDFKALSLSPKAPAPAPSEKTP